MPLNAKLVKPAVIKVGSVIGPYTGGQVPLSIGSGFFVDDNGLLVTNAHVLANNEPDKNFIWLADGTQRQVSQVIHVNTGHDFAILRAAIKGNPFLSLGNYNDVNEGDEVYFAGYPLNSEHHTIHNAYVSAKYAEKGIKVFQLDGSVNSGNSGGPLVSLQTNKVIGIITEKFGGIDDRMKELADFVRQAPTAFSVNYTLKDGRQIKFDPSKAIADLIHIIREYTNLGIGIAFSIEYALAELGQRQLVATG